MGTKRQLSMRMRKLISQDEARRSYLGRIPPVTLPRIRFLEIEYEENDEPRSGADEPRDFLNPPRYVIGHHRRTAWS